ncbi:hypothetical protein AAF712_013259 [Marasmius tenuissimus]|uniref:Uncharacterized protein n=1 Tax=Marasmius tenuissimus TaxID=585030 RepID=A0ABR2ZF46_9AGAR
MASIVAPKLDEGTLPATPAHEWANETSSELQNTSTVAAADSVNRPPMVQAVSTPGVEVPGSYPRGADSTAAATQPSGGILDMAKQYLPAQEDVQGVLKNATETAKTYLPQSVAAYLPGGAEKVTSLPSQEGSQKPLEHSDGVGSLPGNASEASVAKLPEEREQEHKAATAVTVPDTNKPLPDTVEPLPKVEAVSQLTPATNGAMKETVSSASIEAQIAETPIVTPGPQTPHVVAASGPGGVGDLPGAKSEAKVALLPDERKESEPTNTAKVSVSITSLVLDGIRARVQPMRSAGEPMVNLTPHTHHLAAEGTYWKGTALGVDSGSRVDASHLDTADVKDGPPGATFAAPRTAQHTDSTVAVSGHSEPDTLSSPKGSKFSETPSIKNNDLTSTTSAGSDGTEGSRSVGGTPRKAKLMDKIKGEVKVITGKLGGKEDKVEEGRRLMGKV